jgi:molybdate transport system substrate-binding protein
MRAAAALVVAALAALLATSCGGDDGGLRVFAASSLRDALPAVDPDAEYVFAGSDTLATQIREGAAADVYVAAGTRAMDDLAGEGLVAAPTAFASNRLVVVVPRGRGTDIRELADVARPGVRLALAGEGVPAGDYAREALAAAGVLDAALANVVSFEESVSAVVAKVALGEVDAGIVYATDARIARDDVETIAVPDAVQPRIVYLAAPVDGGDTAAAEAFVARLTGAEGQRLLAEAGFTRSAG